MNPPVAIRQEADVKMQRVADPKGHFLGLWAEGAAWWCHRCRRLFDSREVKRTQ